MERRLTLLVFVLKGNVRSSVKGAGVGSGGGSGKSGGSGAAYNGQAGGQGRRIEEGDRNGGKGADSLEDAGGMLGNAERDIEHRDKLHTIQSCIVEAAMFERHQYFQSLCDQV